MNESKSNTTKRVLIWLSVVAVFLTVATVGLVFLAYKPAKRIIATFIKPSFAGVTPIDLTQYYDKSASWNNVGAWEVVPHGSNVLGGVPFQVNGLLRLTGTASEKNNAKPYREKVEGIVVGKKFTRLHVLHLAGSAGETDRPYARLVLNYADGSTTAFPIEYGRHARYWHRSRFEFPSALSDPNSKVVWRGTHESTPKTLRVFKTMFENPKPEEEVTTIDVVSEHATANAVILAMTVSPANVPRPSDDPPSLPEPEESYEGKLKFIAVDAESEKPVSKLTLKISGTESGNSFRAPDATTDAKGEAIVPHPGDSTTSLTLSTIGDGVPQKTIRWQMRPGESIPTEYTYRVTKAVTIGGIVQDESGQPVPGAKLSFIQYGGVTEPNARERFSLGLTTNITDASGRWEFRSLPPGFGNFAVTVSHPDYAEVRFICDGVERNYVGDRVSFRSLLETNAVMKVRKGLSIAGRVLDKDSKPISGAKVLLGDRFVSQPNQTRTDAQGEFKLASLTVGESTLTVQASGFAPEMRRITVGTNATPLEFKLEDGHVFQARIIDEFDTPVRSARITIDQWQGRQTIDLNGTTDTRGRVTIRSAPRDGMSGSIYKSGYMQSSSVQFIADGEEKTFVLRKSATITGSVVDAETKEPIDQFDVVRGQRFGNDEIYWQDYNTIKGRSGAFSFALNEQNITALKAEADGYWPATLSLSSNSATHFTFELKKGNGPKGFVKSGDGQPVPGAQLAVLSKNTSLTMGRTKFTSNGGKKAATTDAAGAFSLRPDSGGETIMVVHTNGYAEASFSNFVSGNTVTLQAWGVIEGQLLIGDNPGTSQSVLLTPESTGANRFWYDYQDYGTTTDAQGKFVISNVPPGERRMVRLIPIDERSRMHSPLGKVTVKSGEVTRVTFGGDGSIIIGQLAMSDPLQQMDWKNSGHHMLSSYPKPPPFKSQEEYRTWQQLPETIEAQKNARSYVVQVDERGAFRVEDVLPGNYDLNINLMERNTAMNGYQKSLGFLTTNVVVAARAPGSKTPVIDLGRLEITLRNDPLNGRPRPAPQAKAPTKVQ